MKERISLLIIAAMMMIAATHNLYSQPALIIHITGGYSLPASDLRGDILDTLNSYYQTKHGFNIGGDAKLGLGRTRALRLVFSLSYHAFTNESDHVINNNVGYEKIRVNNTEIGLGLEMALMPKAIVDPFIGMDLISSFFGGSREFDSPDATHPNASLNAATRYGLALGGGVDFMLFRSLGAVVGAKYHFSDILGKKAGNNIFINPNYNLNDDSKSISFVSFYAGLTLYFGQPVYRRR